MVALVPSSALIDVGGTLYGTTGVGGTHGDGTVFAVTMGGFDSGWRWQNFYCSGGLFSGLRSESNSCLADCEKR